MKFIQSSNEKNVLVNLENVISIEIELNEKEIWFITVSENIFWELNEKDFETDWKMIKSILNSDVSSVNLIK